MNELVAQQVHAVIEHVHLRANIQRRRPIIIHCIENDFRIVSEAELPRLGAYRQHQSVLVVEMRNVISSSKYRLINFEMLFHEMANSAAFYHGV